MATTLGSIITVTGLQSSRLNGLTESVLGRINENINTIRHIQYNFFTFKGKLKLKHTSSVRNEKLTKTNHIRKTRI